MGNFKPLQGLSLQTVFLSVSSAYSAVATAIMMLFAARSSTPEAFGSLAASIAAAVTFVGFADFGTLQLWARNLTSGSLALDDFRAHLTCKILILTLVVCVVLVGSFWFQKYQTQIFITIAVGYVSFLNLNIQVPIRAMGRMDIVAYLTVIERTVALLGMLVWTKLGVSATTALWLAVTCASIVALIIALVLTPKSSRARIHWRGFRNPWAGSLSFGMTGAALSLNGIELYVISSVLGNYTAGMYGAVSRWLQPLYIVVASFASASGPFIASARNSHAAFVLMKKSLWLPISSILGSITIFIFAPQLVELLLGPAYADSALLLRLLLIGSIPAFFNHIATIFLQFLDRERAAALILVPLSVAHLVLVMLLSFAIGAKGAAITYIILQFLQAILFWIVMAQMFRSSKSVGDR